MILVAGATGSLGGRIARRLLDRGEAVRALVRSTGDPGPLEAAGASIAIGDLRDRASLERACQGVTAVVSTASASRRGDDTAENVDLEGTLRTANSDLRTPSSEFRTPDSGRRADCTNSNREYGPMS